MVRDTSGLSSLDAQTTVSRRPNPKTRQSRDRRCVALRPRRHAILRNYPVLGHLRFLLEFIRPEIRQYFIETDREEVPF